MWGDQGTQCRGQLPASLAKSGEALASSKRPNGEVPLWDAFFVLQNAFGRHDNVPDPLQY